MQPSAEPFGCSGLIVLVLGLQNQPGRASLRGLGPAPASMKRCSVMGKGMMRRSTFPLLKASSYLALLHIVASDCVTLMKWIALHPEMPS